MKYFGCVYLYSESVTKEGWRGVLLGLGKIVLLILGKTCLGQCKLDTTST
jgi:hypothetical protein